MRPPIKYDTIGGRENEIESPYLNWHLIGEDLMKLDDRSVTDQFRNHLTATIVLLDLGLLL